MMQQDEDVGKVAATAPVVLSKALELFVKQLVRTTMDVALMHGAKVIQKTHLKGAIVMVPEAFDFLSDVVEDVEDLPPPPDLATLELELEAKANAGGKTKGRKKAGRKKDADEDEDDGALGDLGGGGNLGDLGDFGGASVKSSGSRRRGGGASGTTSRKREKKQTVKKEESEDEEEFDIDEEDTDEEDFDEETYTAPKVTRTGRRVKRKSYADDDYDYEEEEEEDASAPVGGNLASLDPIAAHVGDDEDDYDE